MPQYIPIYYSLPHWPALSLIHFPSILHTHLSSTCMVTLHPFYTQPMRISPSTQHIPVLHTPPHAHGYFHAHHIHFSPMHTSESYFHHYIHHRSLLTLLTSSITSIPFMLIQNHSYFSYHISYSPMCMVTFATCMATFTTPNPIQYMQTHETHFFPLLHGHALTTLCPFLP